MAGLSTPDAALLTTMSMRSKCLRDLGEHVVDAVGHPDAALYRLRPTAERAQLGAKRLGLVMAVVVVHRDIGPGRAELARDGAANAARGTGDQRDFSGEGA